MKSLDELARERNTARKKIDDWMDAEAKASRFRMAYQAPAWAEYCEAVRALDEAANAAGVSGATADT